MKVKMILPALTEANSPYWRPIKYSLFPPLGLATLAGYLPDDWEIDLQDEHVERLRLDDTPDLVVIQVYITSAYRAYALADHYRQQGAYVCLGGLHVTSLPDEAAQHADTIFLGPGEDTWPAFLADFPAGRPQPVLPVDHAHAGTPACHPARPDQASSLPGAKLDRGFTRLSPSLRLLLQGCLLCGRAQLLHAGGRSRPWRRSSACRDAISIFWTTISLATPALPARSSTVWRAWDGCGRRPARCSRCSSPVCWSRRSASGLRSLFVGFETLNPTNLVAQHKDQNLNRDYNAAIRRLHDLGVMVNGSFVFGMDDDDAGVFDRTVEWAVNADQPKLLHWLKTIAGTRPKKVFVVHGEEKSSLMLADGVRQKLKLNTEIAVKDKVYEI